MILCVCPNPSVDSFVWLNVFRPGEVNRIHKEARFPGGKGVHVALALQELGEEVAVLGFWGGPTGDWIKKECEKQGIRCYGPETDEWTRACFTLKIEGMYDHTELLSPGPAISSKDFDDFLQAFEGLMGKAKGITMSGSWPAEAPVSAYAQLIHLAKRAGKKVLLDCTGDGLAAALKERPYLVHLNQSEARDFFTEADPENAMRLLARHCEYAAVTAGAEGLFLAGSDEMVHAACKVEAVRSTVGSGDCLLAGLTIACIRGLDLEEAGKWAVACGAANCIREELGMLYRKDVEALLGRAIIKSHKKFFHLTNKILHQ